MPLFTLLALLDLKTEASFNEKASYMRSGEKAFKNLSSAIVRNFEFLWCTEMELSDFF